tara:strand:+ start:258 stop:719 length:462 start_codon:yes stop_codon:yes gene_type:complete
MGKGKRNRLAEAMRKRKESKTPGNGTTTTMTELPAELEVPELVPEIGDVVLVTPETMLVGEKVKPVAVFVTSVRSEGCLVAGWGMLDPEYCLAQHGGQVVMKQMPLLPFHNLPYSSTGAKNSWYWGDEVEEEAEAPAAAEEESPPPPKLVTLS